MNAYSIYIRLAEIRDSLAEFERAEVSILAGRLFARKLPDSRRAASLPTISRSTSGVDLLAHARRLASAAR